MVPKAARTVWLRIVGGIAGLLAVLGVADKKHDDHHQHWIVPTAMGAATVATAKAVTLISLFGVFLKIGSIRFIARLQRRI